jgi:hypothetical protein
MGFVGHNIDKSDLNKNIVKKNKLIATYFMY